MTARFGRIPLDRITAEWEDCHPINPRLLAGEVAEVLRTMAPADHPIQEARASAILGASTQGGNAVTFGALADYFHSAGQGRTAVTIATSAGPVPASHVVIWRQWLDDLAREATARAVLVAGFAMPANDSVCVAEVANGSPAIRQVDQPPPLTGSEPGYLKMRQAQQRKEGERSAAEQLDAERIARQQDVRELIELRAMLAIKDAQVLQLREESERLHRELSDVRRIKRAAEDEMIRMEEQLEDAMAFAECLRPDNEVSPPELRTAFQCWRKITQDGTHNPAGPGGRGVHTLAADWLKRSGLKLNPTETDRLFAVVSWRKRGSGAIPSK